jgi:hypothetical protein
MVAYSIHIDTLTVLYTSCAFPQIFQGISCHRSCFLSADMNGCLENCHIVRNHRMKEAMPALLSVSSVLFLVPCPSPAVGDGGGLDESVSSSVPFFPFRNASMISLAVLPSTSTLGASVLVIVLGADVPRK